MTKFLDWQLNCMTATLMVGLLAALYMAAMLVCSIAFPAQRFWPPQNSTLTQQLSVWLLTVAIFVSAFVLGLMDWNHLGWPAWLRWGLGLPLILIGNIVVWHNVFQLGLKATSGAAGTLRTVGLYAYSRNPQYVADIGILVGWGILSASMTALPVLVAGIAVLLIAPLAEEPWLLETYGKSYEDYRSQTRRYL